MDLRSSLKLSFLSLITAFAIGCQGCASTPPPLPRAPLATEVFPVWVDSRFSGIEKLAIRDALQEWDKVLNGYAHFHVVTDALSAPEEDPAVILRMAISHQGLVITRQEGIDPELGEEVLAYYDPNTDTIRMLVDRIGDRDFRKIVLHEVGHYLLSPIAGKFDHMPINGSLMSPIYDFQPQHVDCVSAMAVAYAQKWDWHYLTCSPIP